MDPFGQLKETAKTTWPTFGIMETITGLSAPSLVRFAGIAKGATVLDVGCGTGVVALSAARLGARVTGADLTPELLVRARENAGLMKVEIEWHEADVEALPFADASFDFVVSQFGHMFAPRPDVAVAEMLRVVRPGGTVAFSTWPPELYTGRIFTLTSRYAPSPPAGAAAPTQWGDPAIVRARLGEAVRDVVFSQDTMYSPMLSLTHGRLMMESFGPMAKLVQMLESSDPAKLAAFRREFEELGVPYFQDNRLRQDFLMTRAIKK